MIFFSLPGLSPRVQPCCHVSLWRSSCASCIPRLAADAPPGFPLPCGAGLAATAGNVQLGAGSAAATDADGLVYVLHRGKNPLLVFKPDGTFVRSWGDDYLHTPHGLRIDSEQNVWITDIGHHQVFKFDRQGKLLLALGKKGEPGEGRDQFNKPTDVAFAPSGDFYVSDGYGNSRVLKFSKDGTYQMAWGKKGTGPGEFDLPHAIVLDKRGRVIVGDRENNRIQVFSPEGKFLTEWKAGGAAFGLFLTPDERLFVADGRAHWIVVLNLEGRPLGRFGEEGKGPGQFDLPHMFCVAADGAVYGPRSRANASKMRRVARQTWRTSLLSSCGCWCWSSWPLGFAAAWRADWASPPCWRIACRRVARSFGSGAFVGWPVVDPANETLHHLAELGVVVLLFEISLRRTWASC